MSCNKLCNCLGRLMSVVMESEGRLFLSLFPQGEELRSWETKKDILHQLILFFYFLFLLLYFSLKLSALSYFQALLDSQDRCYMTRGKASFVFKRHWKQPLQKK